MVVLLAACGGQDEQVRQENELADWGSRIEIVLRPVDYDDPCDYYATNIRVGINLTLEADVSQHCP